MTLTDSKGIFNNARAEGMLGASLQLDELSRCSLHLKIHVFNTGDSFHSF